MPFHVYGSSLFLWFQLENRFKFTALILCNHGLKDKPRHLIGILIPVVCCLYVIATDIATRVTRTQKSTGDYFEGDAE